MLSAEGRESRPTTHNQRMVMPKSGKSTLKPLLVLIAASTVMWVAGMALHSF
jgi:hypothetical protein